MRRRTVLGVLLLALVTVLGVVAQPAVAAPGWASRSPAGLTIMPHARLVDGGAAVSVSLRIRCVPNGTDGIQWEGFVNVEQGDVFGWKELGLRCDGRWHTQHVVVPVSAEPGTETYVAGPATVTAMLDDENTLTQWAMEVRTVTVRDGWGCPHR
ncbi:hypothetical protein [Actinotalea solisilvae]|uniref:hypothetical protein n=1 Tax=Actinotalea solisilvae TaxID=2072922 RepID=UPI0018F1DDA7|nr:hypothetical protein [Actinotalea solisilvae]